MKKQAPILSPLVTDEKDEKSTNTESGSNEQFIELMNNQQDYEPVWDRDSYLEALEITGLLDEDGFVELWDTSKTSTHDRMEKVLVGPKGSWAVHDPCAFLEAIDPKHRFGLDSWVRRWTMLEVNGDFFDWLDKQPRMGIPVLDPPGEEAEVKYLGDEERKFFQLDVSGGLSWTTHGDDAVNGKLIFALSTDGVLYAGSGEQDELSGKRFHHTSFLSGLPVTTAGTMIVKSGTVTEINGHSGHYLPTPSRVWTGLGALSKLGLSLDGVLVQPKPHEETKVDAKKFLDEGPPKE